MVALCIEKHEKIILIFNIFHIKGNFNIDKKLIIITGPIATKLWWNGPWMAPFQNCVR
jgi:hypothetical protein